MKKGKVSKKNLGEKENILNEIAASLKSVKDDKSEQKGTRLGDAELNEKTRLGDAELEKDLPESGLEEDVELNLGELEFHQFMQPSEDVKAPVLERIAGSAPRPIFVGGIPQGPASNAGTEEKDDFKYLPGGNASDEPKYLGSDSRISAEPRQISMVDTGRRHEIIPEVNQQAFFERASEIRNFESQSVERFERAERFDTARAGRKEPFEREEVKYEKYKPKLPKSY